MRNFDLIQALLSLAGKLQARRVARALRREANLKAAIAASTKGYQEAVKARIDEQYRDLTVKVK